MRQILFTVSYAPRRHEGEEAVEYGDDEEEHHDDDHQGVSFAVNDFIKAGFWPQRGCIKYDFKTKLPRVKVSKPWVFL